MSGEHRNIVIGFTTRDVEHSGKYADDIVGDLAEALRKAVTDWYFANPGLVYYEPDVS